MVQVKEIEMDVHNAHMVTAIQDSYRRAYKQCGNGSINYTQFQCWINGLEHLTWKEKQYEVKESVTPRLRPC